jgi:hydroxyethylthiazole kinase
VHNITNYVTVNDCANIILACGGSPIMADDCSEVEEIVAICNSLVINIGTLNERTVQSMLVAGRKANRLGSPVVFDPVGIGASGLRTDTAKRLLTELDFSIIRGNISEIKKIYQMMQDIWKAGEATPRITDNEAAEDIEVDEITESRGVDASVSDCITEDTLDSTVIFAMELAQMTKAVIVITGAIDIIADTKTAYAVRNGHPMMSRITGSGCMLTSVLGAYSAANKQELTGACAAAVCAMGICGELAYEKVSRRGEGTGSFRTYLMDYMSLLDGTMLEQKAKLQQLSIR